MNRLQRLYPDLDLEAMTDFYKTTAPDRLRELEAACLRGVRAASPIAEEMATAYTGFVKLKDESPEEYRRVVEIERLQYKARELGREIRRLSTLLRKGKAGKAEESRIPAAKRELAELLQTCFIQQQENQLIELNRMEAEVRELRQLLEMRQAHRTEIIEQRFSELSGEHLETAKEPQSEDFPLPEELPDLQ